MSLRRIPSMLWVCGFPYTIELSGNCLNVDQSGETPCSGQVDTDMQTIRLESVRRGKDAPIEFQWSCLLHEIIHIIAEKYAIKELKPERSESAIERLGNALADLFIRNGFLDLEPACKKCALHLKSQEYGDNRYEMERVNRDG